MSYLALLVLYSSLRSPAMRSAARGNRIAPRLWPDLGPISIPTPTKQVRQLAARLAQKHDADESGLRANCCNFQPEHELCWFEFEASVCGRVTCANPNPKDGGHKAHTHVCSSRCTPRAGES